MDNIFNYGKYYPFFICIQLSNDKIVYLSYNQIIITRINFVLL